MRNCEEPYYPAFASESDQGMSKRFYAACAAMQGLCVGKTTADITLGECADIAELSLMIADQLIRQEDL